MPAAATTSDLVAFHAVLGIERVVIVQASPQGTDNSCLLDALRELREQGGQARGVAVVPSTATELELSRLHAEGVRGLRVNLQSYGLSDPALAAHRLQETSRMAATRGWHVQIYTNLGVIAAMADVIDRLPTPVVVDHFALSSARLGATQDGFAALLALVRAGNVFVKLSAPYRIVSRDDGADGRQIARPLIEANLDRMLWGTDWPHTGSWPGQPRCVDTPEPLHPIDDGKQFAMFADWTSAEERQRILVDNPARLYDF